MDLLPELGAHDALRQSALTAFRRPAKQSPMPSPALHHQHQPPPPQQYRQQPYLQQQHAAAKPTSSAATASTLTSSSAAATALMTPPSSRPVSPMFGCGADPSACFPSSLLFSLPQQQQHGPKGSAMAASCLVPDFATPPSSPDRLHSLDFGPAAMAMEMETHPGAFHMVPDMGAAAVRDLLAVDAAPNEHGLDDQAFDELLTLVPDLLTPMASPYSSDSEHDSFILNVVDSLDSVGVVGGVATPAGPFALATSPPSSRPASPLAASGLVAIPGAAVASEPAPRLVSTGTVHNPPRRSRKRRDAGDDASAYAASPAASPCRSTKRGRKAGRANGKRGGRGGVAKRGAGRRSAKVSRTITDKRDSHNVSERQRRKDLKASFEGLRTIVPCMANDPKVHTGTILNNAIDFIRELEMMDRAFEAEKKALRQENVRLRASLRC